MIRVILIVTFGLVLIGSSSANEWHHTASFYQIYPPSFYDDGNTEKPGTGTLKGIEKKLDYIRDLGIQCIWLTPIFKSSFRAYGYDITDYKDIDSRYGTIKDFEELIEKVHEKGMKIIVDFVPNHCGVDHEFFKKSILKDETYENWFVWDAGKDSEIAGNKSPPSNWQRIGGSPSEAWNYNVDRKEYFYAQFSGNMPDFNLRNEAVLEYLEDVMTFWMDKGIDGFRIDAISHGIEADKTEDGEYPDEPVNQKGITDLKDFGYLDHIHTQDQPELFSIIKRWRKFLDDYQADKKNGYRIIMTESYSSSEIIKKFYEAGSDLPFNFQMINQINRNSNAKNFIDMVTDWFKIVPQGKSTNWVIGNHDQPRVASRFGSERIDIFNTLVTLLPGSMVTYYGEEIGMENACVDYGANDVGVVCKDNKTNSDSQYRSPMQWDNTENAGFSNSTTPWLPVASNYETLNVKAQQGNDKSHLEIYKQLMEIRTNKAVIEGGFEMKELSENSFIFKRHFSDPSDRGEKSVLVIINFGNKTEKVNLRSLPGVQGMIEVQVASGNSEYKKNDEIDSNNEIELKEFESIVGFFYNSAISHIISKFALLLLIAACIAKNLNI